MFFVLPRQVDLKYCSIWFKNLILLVIFNLKNTFFWYEKVVFFQHFEIHFFYYVSLICYSILKILFQSFQGSGKTLVYAAPIVSQLKDESEDGFINRLSRPRALVIAPSRELASQILVKKKPTLYHVFYVIPKLCIIMYFVGTPC